MRPGVRKLIASPESIVKSAASRIEHAEPHRLLVRVATWTRPEAAVAGAAVSPPPAAWSEALPNQGPTAARALIKLLAWSS